jgi:hypothetical protein
MLTGRPRRGTPPAPPPSEATPPRPLNLWQQMPPPNRKRLVAHLSRLVQGSLGGHQGGPDDEPSTEPPPAGV